MSCVPWSGYPPDVPGVRISVSRMVLSFGLSDPFLQSVRIVAPKLTAHVGQVNPLMRRHFKFFRLRRWPLNGADVPVVSSQTVRRGEREGRLQIGLIRIPINHV